MLKVNKNKLMNSRMTLVCAEKKTHARQAIVCGFAHSSHFHLHICAKKNSVKGQSVKQCQKQQYSTQWDHSKMENEHVIKKTDGKII